MSGARFGMVAGAFGAYLLALAVLAPATLVDAHLQRASGGAVGLAQARGSLWSGAGRIELRDARGGLIAGRDATWRIVGLAPLAARLELDFVLEGAGRSIPIAISWGQIAVGGGSIELPVSMLGAAYPILGVLGLTGDLRVDIVRLVADRGRMSGAATARWMHAGSMHLGGQPFGEYTLNFEGDEAAGRAGLMTVRGPVALEGTAVWSTAGAGAWRVRATVPAALRARIAPFLGMIATPRGDGVFDIELR